MMEFVKRQSQLESIVNTRNANGNGTGKSLIKGLRNLGVRVLSFFKSPKQAIFMDNYEVITYLLSSEFFHNEVSTKNGLIFCQVIGDPSDAEIIKAMLPTKRDFSLDGNIVIVKPRRLYLKLS